MVTLTFDPVTPKSIGFLCYQGWMCLRKVGQGLLELLIGNAFGTFNPSDFDLWLSDPKINRVPMLPRMDVWTRYEEGWSRCSRVIYLKWFWHIWPQWPWPWPRVHLLPRMDVWTRYEEGWSRRAKQYALYSLKGGIKRSSLTNMI